MHNSIDQYQRRIEGLRKLKLVDQFGDAWKALWSEVLATAEEDEIEPREIEEMGRLYAAANLCPKKIADGFGVSSDAVLKAEVAAAKSGGGSLSEAVQYTVDVAVVLHADAFTSKAPSLESIGINKEDLDVPTEEILKSVFKKTPRREHAWVH